MSASTLTSAPSAAPSTAPLRQPASPGVRLNAELLLNRLAMQLEQVRYLASAGVRPEALRGVVVMLRTAHGLAFRNPSSWAQLSRPRIAAQQGSACDAEADPFDAGHLSDIDEAGLGRASELVDRAADRLTQVGDSLRAKDAPLAWYD